MRTFQIIIHNRSYSYWYLLEQDENGEFSIQREKTLFPFLNPIKEKLFSKDVITINEDNTITLVSSHLKTLKEIPGVLILENDKTYGRTENKRRLLYRCIPDNKEYPVFLIPFEIKLGFSKVQKNKYIIFKFSSWTDKHPSGLSVQTLGDVDILEHYYEYQLYCKELHISISPFINKTRTVMPDKNVEVYPRAIIQNPTFKIEDRRNDYVFSIDPEGSVDFDDAFSVLKIGSLYNISIYISNVYLWLEHFDLWGAMSSRVSTMYLPDRRRTMLPMVLSDTLCSLNQDKTRFAFVMDFNVDELGNIHENSIRFSQCSIDVKKNYVYEEPALINEDPYYQCLFKIVSKMDKNVHDSHDLVASLMILMNKHVGEYMLREKFGVFRSSEILNKEKELIQQDNISTDVKNLVFMLNNVSSSYQNYCDDFTKLQHEIMKMNCYVHITSPIRRLVDLLNMMMMIDKLSLSTLSSNAREFLYTWIRKIDFINNNMKSIKRVQMNCNLIHLCKTNQEVMKVEHKGVLFNKECIQYNGSCFFQYNVYLEDIKLLSFFKTKNELPDYLTGNFKIYMFDDEDKIHKKILLHLCEPCIS